MRHTRAPTRFSKKNMKTQNIGNLAEAVIQNKKTKDM